MESINNPEEPKYKIPDELRTTLEKWAKGEVLTAKSKNLEFSLKEGERGERNNHINYLIFCSDFPYNISKITECF